MIPGVSLALRGNTWWASTVDAAGYPVNINTLCTDLESARAKVAAWSTPATAKAAGVAVAKSAGARVRIQK
jgi:hypothetical protein